MLRFRLLFAIGLLLLAAACSGHTASLPAALDNGAAPSSGAVPELATLPAVHRAAEVPDDYTFAATDLVSQQDSTMTGNELYVKKSDLSWAVLGANFADRTATTITLSGVVKSAYIMVSDYSTGRWKLVSGPRNTGGPLGLPAGIMRADGTTYFAVLCPHNGMADMSVSVHLTGGTPPVPDVWNVMVWIAADNNLAPEGVLNLNQMEQVGSTTDVRVFAGYDIDPGLTGPVTGIDKVHFIKVVHDTNDGVINVGGDPANKSFSRVGYNSADPQNVRAFVDWVNTNFPAKHTALILWDHGGGWVIGNKTVSALAPGGSDLFARKQAGAQRYIQAYQRAYGPHARRHSSSVRGVSDVLADDTEGNGDLTNNATVAAGLAGLHFDVIGFDACNMAQLEALYDFRNLADVLAASECLVPGDGEPYNDMLNAFAAAPTKNSAALGQALVQPFVQHYTSSEYVSFGSFDATKIDALTAALAAFAAEVTPKGAAESAGFQQAMTAAFEPEFGDGVRDLKGFMTSYKGITQDNAIKAKIDTVLGLLGSTVLDFDQYDQVGSNGTAVYLPSGIDDSYGDVAFNTATGWLPMLQAVGIGTGSGGDFAVHADWATGDYIKISWTDPDADMDLETFDPDGTFGAPWMGEDTMNLHFSQDSYDSGLPEEYAQLKSGAKAGDYLIHIPWFDYYGAQPPVTLDVSVQLLDSSMQLKQDLGVCTLGIYGYADYATLHLTGP